MWLVCLGSCVCVSEAGLLVCLKLVNHMGISVAAMTAVVAVRVSLSGCRRSDGSLAIVV